MGSGSSYRFSWTVIILRIHRELRIDIGDYARTHNYTKVLPHKGKCLTRGRHWTIRQARYSDLRYSDLPHRHPNHRPSLQKVPVSPTPPPSHRTKSRYVLASSPSFLLHSAATNPPISYANAACVPRGQKDSVLAAQCAHFFLEPQDWMQPVLDQGELEGKLECPKCAAKVGSYAWQGMPCSCGRWVTPSFALGKARVDEIRRVCVPTGVTQVTVTEVPNPGIVKVETVKSRV
jgi:hypothetical protein